MDQSLSLKSSGLSILKRESKEIVACRLSGDSLLCSSKNFSFFVIVLAFIVRLFPEKSNFFSIASKLFFSTERISA